MSKTYFASDGNYGSADHLIILDTSEWDQEMWDRVQNMTDDERYTFIDEERFAKVNEDMQASED